MYQSLLMKAFYIVPRVQGKITCSNHRIAASQISDQKLHEYWCDWNPAENRNQNFEPPQLRMHLASFSHRFLQLRCKLLTNHPEVKEMKALWDYVIGNDAKGLCCDRPWTYFHTPLSSSFHLKTRLISFVFTSHQESIRIYTDTAVRPLVYRRPKDTFHN